MGASQVELLRIGTDPKGNQMHVQQMIAGRADVWRNTTVRFPRHIEEICHGAWTGTSYADACVAECLMDPLHRCIR